MFFLDFLDSFIEYSLYVIPTGQNILAGGLATSASTSKVPYHPSRQYTVEVKNGPTILDNIKQ